ncbi:sterol desaturase family protein [uncultured Kordia sp.]|uniref:sterol desaturase family protein n=1 Tax=uncultured Kordia sp. TaxID=507699 RepID=UPI0026391DA4|nr:sterol desaturase family protein [uncultured Kordia sp.]
MENYVDIFLNSYNQYWNYFLELIFFQKWDNYFYGLIVISLVVWLLEIMFPWRKNQSIFRKDFWLDTFYMFFNFFIFNIIIFVALSNTTAAFFNDILGGIGMSLESLQLFNISALPAWLGLLIFFVVTDFVQWNTHRLLHRVEFLWNFHKVHHSVKEMGFAAHLRYHWMETVVYKSLLYLPVAIIGGFNVQHVAFVYFFTISVGHLNHANLGWDYGFLKYIFNNPKMHIWHHSKELPVRYGVNFGLTLSVWDYFFKTNYIPKNGRDIELGFTNDESFPQDFLRQEIYPINLKKE